MVISLEESAQHHQRGGVRTPEDGGALEIEEAVCRGVQGVDLG